MTTHETRSETNCGQQGLTCGACVASTARELAGSCKGLRGKMVAQLFVQLYPAPDCSRMHARFLAEYRAALHTDVRRPVGDHWEEVPTRPIARAMVAGI
jgi:hypothetical protein